jgi:chorismate synthase
VVGEAMVAFVLADALIDKFGGDSIEELLRNWQSFRDRTSARFDR